MKKFVNLSKFSTPTLFYYTLIKEHVLPNYVLFEISSLSSLIEALVNKIKNQHAILVLEWNFRVQFAPTENNITQNTFVKSLDRVFKIAYYTRDSILPVLNHLRKLLKKHQWEPLKVCHSFRCTLMISNTYPVSNKRA